MKIWEWVKRNKLSTFLILLLVYFLGQTLVSNFLGISLQRIPSYEKRGSSYELGSPASGGIGGGGELANISAPQLGRIIPPPQQDYTPSPEIKDRLVIQQSYLSLLVKNVRETVDKILEHTSQSGGYMVNSSLENPGEAPYATVIIRIPANKLSQALDFFRSLSLKVVSENLTGYDVTDQYVDIETRLATLSKTKTKFEDMLDKAVEISDILNVQRELINLESQIDQWKGQQQYLEKSAQMAKVTIYLSTDEIALPYTPSETWRADVIFKLAVRSLIANLRKVATAFIWVVVYSVIWIPLLSVIYFIKKRRKFPSTPKPPAAA